VAQASSEMAAIARSLEREFPQTNMRVGAFVAPLRDHFVADLRTMLAVLAGAVGFVLLIACANIANLLLSRATNRRREVAIRAAIGAGRGQVIRQLLTENLLLAGAGGLCGFAMAFWGVRFLARMLPPGMAAMSAVAVDTRVLAFTLAVSVLTGVAFGLAPAFEMLRAGLHDMLKQGGGRQGASGGSRGLRRALVISEVALAFVLAVGAALFIQSFARLRSLDPGFRTANILTLRTPASGIPYRDPAKRAAFYKEVLERVQALPGVVSAGYTNGIPLVVKGNVNGFTVEGMPRLAPGTYSNANYRIVTADYMRTIGLPLRQGRYLDRHDTADSPPVALINEAMKRKFWPQEDAMGKRLRFGSSSPWVTVMGVVGDMRQSGLEKPPAAELYLPSTQDPSPLSGLAIRASGDPAHLADAVRREIRAVDKGVPIMDVRTMEEVLDLEVFQRRAQTRLLAIFAAVALLLASLGIYGVLACLVSQSTQEIGIRMALGAAPRDVLLAVAGQGIALSAAGIALGACGALALNRLVSRLLFGIAAGDPATFVAVAALLLGVASAASFLPARRAMKIDPILALRQE
jgi:putative ABC transport system permease protein